MTTTIDESLYSRQLYVLGHEAMQQMSQSNVLIIGLTGLGVECAKNVILAGVKSVTLHDPHSVQMTDLSSQFYLTAQDVKQKRGRAEACKHKLEELNQYVPVSTLPALDINSLQNYTCVVLINQPLHLQKQVNAYTHAHSIKFISCESRGLFGSVFCDFGSEFVVKDINGEVALHGMVSSITPDDKKDSYTVTCLDEHRHGLEDGDCVTFHEVQGMQNVNARPPAPIKILGPYSFQVTLTNVSGEYTRDGGFTQVKQHKVLKFKALEESLKQPEYMIGDFGKFDRPAQLHLAFQALHKFHDKHSRMPLPRNEQDAQEVFSSAQSLVKEQKLDIEVDEKLIKMVSYLSQGDLSPMNAFLGGLVGQEVLKACSGKFHPIVQWLYFDSLESLPTDPVTEEDCQPTGSRYDGQIAVFGRKFQDKLSHLKLFLVGAGAIGCEMLKNWAMMGVSTGKNGSIMITDMDTIEKSNLNRQFLFRSADVGKFKSVAAASAIAAMNADLSHSFVAKQDRVGEDSENIFDDAFWEGLDVVTNALDNLIARKYVDQRCVLFNKPLLESGTLGTKGNTQVVLPKMTESYSSSQDPPEKSIPMCTLRNFPNQIEHTIEWSRNEFEGTFVQQIENVNLYLSRPDFCESTVKQGANAKDILASVQAGLTKDKASTFEECVTWARLRFEELFNNSIQQLLYNFPRDAVTSSGAPFWSGPKRAPTPITFDPVYNLHIDFIVAASSLHAFNYGLKALEDRATIKNMAQNVMVPEFAPKTNVKIQVSETEAVAPVTTNESELDSLIHSLPDAKSMAGYRLTPAEFEKDDDTNHHIDFITAVSNLRATNYNIAIADRHKTKGIAGKIIPAIATTTALVTGLVCLELYKIVDGKKKLEDFKNGFINLALPFFGFSEPIAMPSYKYHETTFTLWDRFEIAHDLTLRQLLDLFKTKHELEITMLSCGASVLYTFFMPKKKQEERMGMMVTAIYEQVTKKPIPAYVKMIQLDCCVNDRDGEDVEVPSIKVKIR